MTDRNKLLLLQLGLVLGVCYFFFFFGLGAFGLVGADEPRYAQIAREMFTRHHYIVPTLNGHPWLEKPVFAYWKMIAAFRLFGVSDWAARLPAAFHATLLVVGVFFFMRRFRFTSELDAAMITVSSAGMIAFGRGASTDILISTHFSLAMLSWWTWRETGKKLWLLAFYVLLGIGALAKGPVAPALAVLVVGAYAVLRRDGKIFVRSLSLPGFLLFCAIALPWYFALQHKVPQFFRVFFIEHNLERFGTNLYQHSQPFWYYIPVFLLATLPWTVFVVPALIEAGRRAIKQFGTNSEPPPDPDDGLPGFLLVWTLIPIIFFSISRSKLPGYILPSIPAAALLTADYLHRTKAVSRLTIALHALVCSVLLVCALVAPFIMMKMPPPSWMGLITIVTGGVIAFLVMLMVRREGVRALHFVTLIPMILGVAFLLRPAAPVIDQAASARSVQARLEALGYGTGPLAVFHVRREVAYGLNFYRNQGVVYYGADGPADMPHGMPPEAHILALQYLEKAVARQEQEKQEILDKVGGMIGRRSLASVGAFPPQHLEFFLVGPEK